MGRNHQNNSRRILVVDDDRDSAEIVSQSLQWEGYQVVVASSGEEAIDRMKDWAPHIVLLDINMEGLSGLDTLRKLRQKQEYVSVIFVSGNSNSEDVIRGLDTGADDYICKPFDPQELLARVRTQIRIKDLNDQLRVANEKLRELVNTDDLTGLYNMRSLYRKLDQELDRARRFKRSVCAVMMDMDHFKSVNDTHDHLFGSFVLSEVGHLVKDNIRSVDFAARYGGDEFLIVLTEVDIEGSQLFCERLRKKIQSYTFKNDKDQMSLTASLGLAITEPGNNTLDARDLVRLADQALYKAKDAGRNCVVAHDLSQNDSQLEKKRVN